MADVQPVDRRRTIRLKAWAAVVLAAAAVVVVLIAATVANLRVDMTEDRIYSLSDSTKQLLAELEEPIQIRAYVTDGLPQPYGRLKRFLTDMLLAYHEAGHGKVGFEVVDPADDAKVASALKALNIPKVRVQVVENDQAQVKQGYLAVLVEYLDRKETIPVVRSEEGFEYLLTRKIKKLTGKGKGKIGVVKGFGSHGLQQLGRLRQLAGDNYELVDVAADKPLPDDLNALIVDGLKKEPDAPFRYRLDQFRMQGKGVLLLAGNAEPVLSMGFHVEPVDAAALRWIGEDFDIAIEPGLVLDRQATRVNVTQRQDIFMIRSVVDYPFLPTITEFPATSPVVAGLEAVSVPFASPLLWREQRLSQQVLMRSSPASAVQSGPPFDVDPLMPIDERFAGLTPRASAVALLEEGAMRSVFDKAPAGVGGPHVEATDHGRLIVIGAPAFLDDEFVDGGNLVMILNMLDWLSGDEALIGLRSRGVTQRPLAELSNAGRTAFKGLWMLGLPGLVLLLGLGRWWRLRRRSRQATA